MLPVEPREGTHDHRVLTLLRDGKPHTHLEVYDLRVVCHSRIAGLRKKGFGIRAWREGDLYMYQLVLDGAGKDGSDEMAADVRPTEGISHVPEAGFEADSSPAPSSTIPLAGTLAFVQAEDSPLAPLLSREWYWEEPLGADGISLPTKEF